MQTVQAEKCDKQEPGQETVGVIRAIQIVRLLELGLENLNGKCNCICEESGLLGPWAGVQRNPCFFLCFFFVAPCRAVVVVWLASGLLLASLWLAPGLFLLLACSLACSWLASWTASWPAPGLLPGLLLVCFWLALAP